MKKFYLGYHNSEADFDEVMKHVPQGWRTVLQKGFERMFASGWDGKIVQIKEKFGTLRLYQHGYDDTLDEIINDMEEQTAKVCSVCGNPSTCVTKGWILHRCDEHKELTNN